MFTPLWRAALTLPVLLALAAPGRAEVGSEHLFLGNPSGAVADPAKRDNHLVRKRGFVLSYNNSRGTPN
jgi:endonuclease G